jgi:hypothetical protein
MTLNDLLSALRRGKLTVNPDIQSPPKTVDAPRMAPAVLHAPACPNYGEDGECELCGKPC